MTLKQQLKGDPLVERFKNGWDCSEEVYELKTLTGKSKKEIYTALRELAFDE